MLEADTPSLPPGGAPPAGAPPECAPDSLWPKTAADLISPGTADHCVGDALALAGGFVGAEHRLVFLPGRDGRLRLVTDEAEETDGVEGVGPSGVACHAEHGDRGAQLRHAGDLGCADHDEQADEVQVAGGDLTWPGGPAWPGGPELDPGWARRLRQGELVWVGRDEEAPGLDAVRADRRMGALVVVPMPAGGELLGAAVLGRDRDAGPSWPDRSDEILRLAGEVLARAVVRCREIGRLVESEGRYRSLVEDVRDVIVRIDAKGQIAFVNNAWTELTGLTPAETLKRGALESVHPEDRLIAAEHMASAAHGTDDQVRQVRFIAKDGSVRWLDVKGRAVFDAEGRMAGYAGVLHDVTERKMAEQRIQEALEEAERARDEAQRASRAKSEFLSRMSHELRTPLNAVLGFAQLLEYAELGEEEADGVRLILDAGRHLLGLINDTLDVSRIETGRLALSLEPVPLAEVCGESFDLVRSDAAEAGVTLHRSSGPGPHVVADRQRLKQVLVNLLSNAIKYNRPGGRVTVGWRALSGEEIPGQGTDGEHGWTRVTVTDTGTGIPVDRLNDVFTPFERLGAEYGDIEGTGIGLALTKSLVEAMSGRIGLTSDQAEGTTFFVDLPAKVPAWSGGEPAVTDTSVDPSRFTRTVLYIEDNSSNVVFMRRVLGMRPHIRLLVAQDGVAGLEMLRRERPDLLLLDLHLPGLDGVHILSALRGDLDSRLRAIPVIMITADLSRGIEDRMVKAGATAFLGKPVDVRTLLELIDRKLSDTAQPSAGRDATAAR